MACFLTTCFLLIAGCSSMTDNTKPSRTESSTTDNTNLFIKIDIEKNGVPLDFLSSIASKDVINISQALQEKQENGSLSSPTMFKFSGNNIKRLSAGNYSIDYKVGLQVPISVSAPQAQGKDSTPHQVYQSVQYVDTGTTSSINVELNQPVYIFGSKTYKIKMTVNTKN